MTSLETIIIAFRAQSIKDELCDGDPPDHDAAGTTAHELDDLLAKLKTRADPG